MMRIRSVSLKFMFETCLVLGALRGLITAVAKHVTEPASRTFGLDLMVGIPLNAFVLGLAGVLVAWFYNRFGVRWGGGFVIELEPVDGPSTKTPGSSGAPPTSRTA